MEHIERDGVVYAAGSRNDLWHLDRINQLSSELDNSYESLHGGGEGVDVYVLDTGIRYQHQEFEYRAKYEGYDPVDQYEYQLGAKNYEPRRGADCNGHPRPGEPTCIACACCGVTAVQCGVLFWTG